MFGDGFTNLDDMLFEEFLEYALENGEDYAIESADFIVDTIDLVQASPQKKSISTSGAVVNTRDFVEFGSCRGTEPKIFFPEYKDSRAEAAAKMVCRSCVVQAECLDYALNNDEQSGVWGGMSEKDRSRLARKRRNTRAA